MPRTLKLLRWTLAVLLALAASCALTVVEGGGCR